MRRKWIGIRVSAGLALAGSVLTLVMGGLMLVSTLLAPLPAGPAAPPFPMKAMGIVMFAMSAGMCGWGSWTAIAIFQRRGWARISMLIFAVLLTFMSVGGCLAIAFVQLPAQEGVNQSVMDVVRWGVAGLYALLAATGIWWLVLFNLRSTKEYFTGTGPIEPDVRPLSISMIAWYLLISSLFVAALAVFRLPAFVFGTVISGWGGMAVYTVFAGVQIFLGSGLLQLQEQARVGTIGYFCFTGASGLVTMLLPGWPAQIQAMQQEMPKLFPAGAPAQMPQPAWAFGLMGTVFVAIPIWFLIQRRDAFVKAE